MSFKINKLRLDPSSLYGGAQTMPGFPADELKSKIKEIFNQRLIRNKITDQLRDKATRTIECSSFITESQIFVTIGGVEYEFKSRTSQAEAKEIYDLAKRTFLPKPTIIAAPILKPALAVPRAPVINSTYLPSISLPRDTSLLRNDSLAIVPFVSNERRFEFPAFPKSRTIDPSQLFIPRELLESSDATPILPVSRDSRNDNRLAIVPYIPPKSKFQEHLPSSLGEATSRKLFISKELLESFNSTPILPISEDSRNDNHLAIVPYKPLENLNLKPSFKELPSEVILPSAMAHEATIIRSSLDSFLRPQVRPLKSYEVFLRPYLQESAVWKYFQMQNDTAISAPQDLSVAPITYKLPKNNQETFVPISMKELRQMFNPIPMPIMQRTLQVPFQPWSYPQQAALKRSLRKFNPTPINLKMPPSILIKLFNLLRKA